MASQEYQQLLDNHTPDLLHEVLSGELAKEHVIAISRYHRIQGSRESLKAAGYVLELAISFQLSAFSSQWSGRRVEWRRKREKSKKCKRIRVGYEVDILPLKKNYE